MTDDDRDWFERLDDVRDRWRMMEEMSAPEQKPLPMKRVAPYMPPSGRDARHMNRVNAQMRIQQKRGRGMK